MKGGMYCLAIFLMLAVEQMVCEGRDVLSGDILDVECEPGVLREF